MARVVLTIKLVLAFSYNAAAALFLQGTTHVVLEQYDVVTTRVVLALATLFVLVVLLPEIAICVSKGFRYWIRQGIEDADGKFNKSDFKDAMIIYVSLWFMRIFLAFSIVKMFGVEIDTVSYLATLFASFGIAGITMLRPK